MPDTPEWKAVQAKAEPYIKEIWGETELLLAQEPEPALKSILSPSPRPLPTVPAPDMDMPETFQVQPFGSDIETKEVVMQLDFDILDSDEFNEAVKEIVMEMLDRGIER